MLRGASRTRRNPPAEDRTDAELREIGLPGLNRGRDVGVIVQYFDLERLALGVVQNIARPELPARLGKQVARALEVLAQCRRARIGARVLVRRAEDRGGQPLAEGLEDSQLARRRADLWLRTPSC